MLKLVIALYLLNTIQWSETKIINEINEEQEKPSGLKYKFIINYLRNKSESGLLSPCCIFKNSLFIMCSYG